MQKLRKTSTLELAQADGREPELVLQGSQPGTNSPSVTLLRFHGGARMRATSDDIRISFNLKGSVRKTCEWRFAGTLHSHVAQENAVYVCPPHSDYSVETDSNAEILAISIPGERLAMAIAACAARADLVPLVGGTDPALLRLVQALLKEASTGYCNGSLYWHDLSDRVVSHLLEQHLSRAYRPVGGILTETVLKRINDFIASSLGDDISLDDLAKVAGQSRFHFDRTFTSNTGITPYRYLMHRRLDAAIEMIRKGALPLKDIAAETGFADQSHLARWSKAIRGLRLTEYRNQKLSVSIV
jgi:AraC family transcriptional regulator